MTADLIDALFRANLAACDAILLVLILRGMVRRGFGARIAYRLWILPPLIGAATFLPFPQGAGGYAVPVVLAPPVTEALQAAGDATSIGPTLLAALWIVGVVLCGAVLALRQARFIKALGVLHPITLGGRRVLRAARADVGPAVIGADIVVPADFEARFTAEEQEAILAHEAAHLARGDVVVNALTALVQCFCWFNPLVHIAVHQARIDQELACDATVIEARPALRRSYGEALLKTQLAPGAPPVGCTWPSRAAHPLKVRIAMLKSSPPTRRRRMAGVTLLAVLSLGGGYAAWASQTEEPTLITAPDWYDRPTGADMAHYYPADAVRQNLDGMVVMRCRVELAGTLSGCGIESQAPAGAGFDAAALQLSERFRMRPLSRDGRPVAGGVVRIPIMFKINREPPAPDASAPG